MQSWCIDDDSLLNRGFFEYFTSSISFSIRFLLQPFPENRR